MKKIKIALFAVMFVLSIGGLHALDFYSHPEIADKNSIFADLNIMRYDPPTGIEFPSLSFKLDYVLPVFLPLSIGAYLVQPTPYFNNFGTRLAYHLDIDQSRSDLYVVWVMNFGFIQNRKYNIFSDYTPVPVKFDDVRLGFRFFFTHNLGMYTEIAYNLTFIDVGVSFKLN